jgi:nitroreductase
MTIAAAIVTPDTLLEALNWRYATKVFDPARKISQADWKALEESLVLAPSSYGLQPYRFLVILDPKLRDSLRQASWGQSQVTDASHFMVFTVQQGMTEADVDRWLARVSAVRGVEPQSLMTYREMMVGDLVKGARSSHVADWAARQAYIALGQLLTESALLGIDACPMEGIDREAYDTVLGLGGTGFKTQVVCALGYRSVNDKYAGLKKVRYGADRLVVHR